MVIKTIASSSLGCCYLVESNGYQLILECGVSVNKIRQALNFDLSHVVGCLVSHEHGDHSKYLPQLEKETSIPIWCSESTKKRYNLSVCNTFEFQMFYIRMPPFNITPVSLCHDVECFGFMINGGSDILFFATDTGKINYNIPGLTYVMIEANHSFEKLIESERDRSIVARISENHLDIDKVVDFCKLHPDLKEIHLIHLSDAHSDEALFKKMVSSATGVPVYIAKK